MADTGYGRGYEAGYTAGWDEAQADYEESLGAAGDRTATALRNLIAGLLEVITPTRKGSHE
ncbi:hypothetical protein [Zhihengliuella sp.]|uniref:hypothetical protein n=1 Tax=Zhihengliuella sp. TaxID=1954483 RepID=UPI002810B73C|nr:hypothetical protein [Zhihengliuella sp.]